MNHNTHSGSGSGAADVGMKFDRAAAKFAILQLTVQIGSPGDSQQQAELGTKAGEINMSTKANPGWATIQANILELEAQVGKAQDAHANEKQTGPRSDAGNTHKLNDKAAAWAAAKAEILKLSAEIAKTCGHQKPANVASHGGNGGAVSSFFDFLDNAAHGVNVFGVASLSGKPAPGPDDSGFSLRGPLINFLSDSDPEDEDHSPTVRGKGKANAITYGHSHENNPAGSSHAGDGQSIHGEPDDGVNTTDHRIESGNLPDGLGCAPFIPPGGHHGSVDHGSVDHDSVDHDSVDHDATLSDASLQGNGTAVAGPSSDDFIGPREPECRATEVYVRKGLPDREEFRATADRQIESAVMRLPAEVRSQIFREMLSLRGNKFHIHAPGNHRRTGTVMDLFSFAPCVSHFELSRERNEVISAVYEQHKKDGRLVNAPDNDFPVLKVNRRQYEVHHMTHRECFGIWRRTRNRWLPFLPVMLTCKRIYLETVDLVVEITHFLFSSERLAHSFFEMVPNPSFDYLTRISFVFERWSPKDPVNIIGEDARACLWSRLANLPNLREVHILLNGLPAYHHPVDGGMVDDVVTYRHILDVVGPLLESRLHLHVPEQSPLFCVESVCEGRGLYAVASAPPHVKVHSHEVPKFEWSISRASRHATGFCRIVFPPDQCNLCISKYGAFLDN